MKSQFVAGIRGRACGYFSGKVPPGCKKLMDDRERLIKERDHNMAEWQKAMDSAQDQARLANVLRDFHDAWVEAEIAKATGDPDLATEKRLALVAVHQRVQEMMP